MLEKDTADLWCPMVRHHGKTMSGYNRHGSNNDQSLGVWNSCIGRRCAMWRWSEPEQAHSKEDNAKGNRHGFCGLAGPHTID